MRVWKAALAAAVALAAAAPAAAQIPEKFTNLQVLPRDIPRDQLVRVMRGFTTSLGVRCNHCHVGPGPATLEGFDFASDDKETKRVARVMMKMTQEINTRLLPQTGRSPLTEVRCMTCHRGVAKPELPVPASMPAARN